MSFQTLIKKLADKQIEIFQKYGVVTLPKAIVVTWDPYSISAESRKTYQLYKDVTFRFADRKLTTEKLSKGYYLQEALAEELIKSGTPIFYTQHADLYGTKLEMDLNQKPVIEIPEDLEMEGATLPFGTPPLEAIIINTIGKAGKGRASETAIINYITQDPPLGAGWYKHTPTLIQSVKHTLERLKYRGVLDYDPKTLEYVLVVKQTSTVLGG